MIIKFMRRKHAVAVTTLSLTLLIVAALSFTLFNAAGATAAPRSLSSLAVAGNDDLNTQPPMSEADADRARAAMVPAHACCRPTAKTSFAVVNANGTLARGFQAVSANKLGTGIYQVFFNHDIRDSAFIGTIGLSTFSGDSPSGEIAVVGRAGTTNGVFVQTFNSNGIRADLGFHLAVHTP